MIDRTQFLALFQASRDSGETGYARSLATDWLAVWPGDQEVRVALAELEWGMKLAGTAIIRLEEAVTADPEFEEAYDLLAEILRADGQPTQASVYRACAQALKSGSHEARSGPSWARPLAAAVRYLRSGEPDTALGEIQTVLASDLAIPLPLLVAARIHVTRGDDRAAASIARLGHDRWPETVAFNLMIAVASMKKGDSERGVAALHRAASQDPTGRVATQFLGSGHPYAALWPEKLEMKLLRPIPASTGKLTADGSVSHLERTSPKPDKAGSELDPSELDAAQEAAPEGPSDLVMPEPEPWEAYDGPDPGDDPATPPARSADSVAFQDSLERMATQFNAGRPIDNRDARRPVYILLSSRVRLIQVFGEAAAERIEDAAEKLVQSVNRRPGWKAHLLYIDDPASMKRFGLAPVDPTNAWQIKLRLADLDQALAARGDMIGALFILGGHRIIPFHMLPNPTDDTDSEVPSDNPYSTIDENYFAPQWPVGRAPSDGSADLIVKMLRNAAHDHLHGGRSGLTPLEQARLWLANRLGGLFRVSPHSVGYSASIWKKASMAVYRSIGEPGSLLTSPPVEATALPPIAMRPSVLSYFNLHGLEDSPEWYGQRDPVRDRKIKTEFPVALRTDDVVNGGRAPKIVFTEACYGAHVMDKDVDEALSLKFLDSGSHVVVGSTKISYGSITPPLIAADLLGRLFWTNLNRLLPAGEALRRAKLQLATEMHRRQGYLDGEDQKTIISFVLYGDPLYSIPFAPRVDGRKTVVRTTQRPKAMKTACAKGHAALEAAELDRESQSRVDQIVAKYLPGMQGATCTIHEQHQGCRGEDHVCPSVQVGMKDLPRSGAMTKVITLSKRTPYAGVEHPHFARVTLDQSGRVLKLAVSR